MSETENRNSSLSILFEDDCLLVVDKPAGLLSVPGRGPNKQDSVQSRANQRYPQALIVHRLDCATSGLMVLAKTKAAQSELSRQFREREIHKEYRAVCFGQRPASEGEIAFPLIADWPNRPRQKICYDTGKSALTRYRLLSAPDNLNQQPNTEQCHTLQLFPVTGRSHQLRLHTLAMGLPILGDVFYAPDAVVSMSDRLMLHAYRLQLTHPSSGEALQFTAPLPF